MAVTTKTLTERDQALLSLLRYALRERNADALRKASAILKARADYEEQVAVFMTQFPAVTEEPVDAPELDAPAA